MSLPAHVRAEVRSVLDGQPSLEPTNGLMPEHKGLRTTDGRNGAGRNKRTVWTIATQPYAGAHFATFPRKLIEPCILAGAPEWTCGACGAPWVRVVERGDLVPVRGNRLEGDITDDHKLDGSAGSIYGAKDRMVRTDEGWSLLTRERISKGFEATCAHGDGSATGVVLDPFAGSGTTGMVALRHGRSFLGVELSPAYAAMARERIVADAPLLNSGAEMAL